MSCVVWDATTTSWCVRLRFEPQAIQLVLKSHNLAGAAGISKTPFHSVSVTAEPVLADPLNVMCCLGCNNIKFVCQVEV